MRLSKSLVISVMVLIAFNVMVLPVAMAGDVTMTANATISSSFTETVTTDLEFGSIDLNPGGDTIILDASGGATTAATIANGSIVTGETSGLITIEHSMIISLWLSYPAAAVTLTNGTDNIDITAGSIATNSEYSSLATAHTSPDATSDITVDVGGEIVVPAAQPDGLYTGTMTITINYL